MAQRLAVDLSLLLRWTGPPVGIMRVEAEIARRAIGRRDTDFVFFDTRSAAFRTIRPESVRSAIAGTAAIDLSGMPDPREVRRDAAGSLLHRLDPYLTAVRRPRRFAIDSLERARDLLPAGGLHDAATRMQEKLFSARHRRLYFDREGRRRTLRPIDRLLGPPAPLDRDTVLFSAGADWNTKNPAHMHALKQRDGWRLVNVCYDLIPLDMPHFFPPRDVAVVGDYFRRMIGATDRFVAISQATARDLRAFADRENLALGDVQVEPLGSDLPAAAAENLPPGLSPQRYILFVSTIEPRKNHAILLRAWERLNREGLPEKAGVKLVFVGRHGWDVDPVLKGIAEARNLIHLADADDSLLSLLYEKAAFCVYPSLYEGYGLPIVEAFRHGRAVIASDRGSIPEVMADLGPCLDPGDEDAWAAALRDWIIHPAAIAEREAAIRAGFRPVTWDEAAARYIGQALSVFDLPPR